jgi:hypothetical protein
MVFLSILVILNRIVHGMYNSMLSDKNLAIPSKYRQIWQAMTII